MKVSRHFFKTTGVYWLWKRMKKHVCIIAQVTERKGLGLAESHIFRCLRFRRGMRHLRRRGYERKAVRGMGKDHVQEEGKGGTRGLSTQRADARQALQAPLRKSKRSELMCPKHHSSVWDAKWKRFNDSSQTFVVAVQSLSHVRLFVTPWPVAHQAPLSMGFSRQGYWSGLPCPPPGDLPRPGLKPASPALQADSLPLSRLGSPVLKDAWFYPHIWKVGYHSWLCPCHPHSCVEATLEWAYLRRAFRGVIIQNEVLGWVLIPPHWCSHQKGTPRDREDTAAEERPAEALEHPAAAESARGLRRNTTLLLPSAPCGETATPANLSFFLL